MNYYVNICYLYHFFYYSSFYLLHFIADLYIKARTAVRGFVAEGSNYETEKETGRGKRKKIRNRLFEHTDSDEEIVKHSEKAIPAPPAVSFKRVSARNDIIQKTGNELNNCLSPMTSFPPSKVSHMFIINIILNFKKSYHKLINFNILEKIIFSGMLKTQCF